MSKDVQADFKKAVERAGLYAEQAMIVTLGFKADACDPKTQQDALLAHLKEQGVGHKKLYQADNMLTFAVAREKDLEAENIRRVVNAFFTGARAEVLNSQAYYQKYNSQDEMTAAMPKISGRARRTVARVVKGF